MAPCPICSRTKYCSISTDTEIVFCTREASDWPSSDGVGWMHRIADADRSRVIVPPPPPPPLREAEIVARYAKWLRNTPSGRRDTYADGLGLDPNAVALLAPAHVDGDTWAWPMRNGNREIIGIRLRSSTRKWSVRGGKEGAFLLAAGPADDLLVMAEGPTDTAAWVGWGYDVAGRPSCDGGVQHCLVLGRDRDVVVAADADEPGRRGAARLARALHGVAASVRVVEPVGSKDWRDMARAGATWADVAGLVERVEVLQ